MASDEELLERLDRITALLAIGFGEHVERIRAELQAEPVTAAVLELVRDDWVPSGDIKRAVSKSASVSEKTVQRSLAALGARGAIRARGTGPNLSYRSAGIV